MDQTRRKLVLASASVPATLMLQACGGGDSDLAGAGSSTAPKATALAAKPTSGGYIDIGNVSSKSIDSVFRSGGTSEYLRYFVPVASNVRTQAVLQGASTSKKTAFVSLTEVLTTKTTPAVTHHRHLSLELADFPAVGASKQYNATTGYKGTLVVNTTTADGAGAKHYDYELKTGGIKVTHVSEGVMKLEFVGVGVLSLDYVDGAPITSQTFSTSPGTSLTLLSGSNLAVNPFILKNTSSSAITVAYAQTTCDWI